MLRRLLFSFCFSLFCLASPGAYADWQLEKQIDPFTDKEQLFATNGPVVAWCDQSKGLSGRPSVVIKTQRIPDAMFYDNRSAYNRAINAPGADSMQVNIRYRFDNTKAKDTRAELAKEYTGIQFCGGWGPHCAKGFMRRMYAANQLIYEVDTAVQGKERGTINLSVGRGHLKTIMDACGLKPKKYKGLGAP